MASSIPPLREAQSSPHIHNPSPYQMSKRSRQFWKGKDIPARDQETTSSSSFHQDSHPDASIISSSKKDSIENLKKAERVTNVKSSTMFAASAASELTPPNSTRSRSRSTDRPMVAGSPLRPLTATHDSAIITKDVNNNILHHNNNNNNNNDNNAAAAAASTAATPSRPASSSPTSDARLLLPSQRNGVASAALIGRPSLISSSSTNSSLHTTPSASPTKTTFPLQKSSISRNGRYSGRTTNPRFASDIESWSESANNDTFMERQQKSVTFDDAPPQVNEYEMATPAPSSTSSIHDGSYDSDDFDEESFERGSSVDMEDSFDASLEDTEKTPVVLPDEWRFMTPDDDDEDEDEDEDDDDDESTEMGDESLAEYNDSEHTQTPASSHLDSFDSSTERRPLPMPPSTSSAREQPPRPTSQLSNHPHPLQQHQHLRQYDDYPHDARKVDGRDASSLEEKFELLRIRESADAIKEAQRQRERRLRRGAAGSRDRNVIDSSSLLSLEKEKENKRPSSRAGQNALAVEAVNSGGGNDSSGGDSRDVQSFAKANSPPVQFPASKEAAAVEVRSHQKPGEGDSAMEFASMSSESEIHDADMPLPSVESNDDDHIEDEKLPDHPIDDIVEEEEEDDDEDIEAENDKHHSQPDRQFVRDARGRSPDDVDADHFPQPPPKQQQQKEPIVHEMKVEPTPPPLTRKALEKAHPQDCSVDYTPVDSGLGINSEPSLQGSLIGGGVDYDDGRINPMSKDEQEHVQPLPDDSGRHTPESQIGLEEEDLDRTPESVIRHPIPESAYGDDTEDESYFPDEYDEFSFEYSPEPPDMDIPEYVATVRAHDGQYKIRPSLTLADTQTMAAMRREVSTSAHSIDGKQQQQQQAVPNHMLNEHDYDEEDNDLTPTLEDSRVHDRSILGRDDEELEEDDGVEEEEIHDRRHVQQEQMYLGDHRERPVSGQRVYSHQRDGYEKQQHPRQQQEQHHQGNLNQRRVEEYEHEHEHEHEQHDQQYWEDEERRQLEQEDEQYHDQDEEQEHEGDEEAEEEPQNHSTGKKPRPSLVKLDVPVGTGDEDLSLGISEEFDRLMQARKQEEEAALEELRRSQLEKQKSQANSLSPDGVKTKPKYLMRQATKVVVASSRPSIDSNTRRMDNGAGSKSGAHRRSSQFTWTTEPWHSGGKGRRRSQRGSGVGSQRRSLNGGTHQSATQNGLDKSIEEEWADGEERGRLFVKVLRVKDLDLPLPRTQRNQFSLTLDNGMHCVTTNWLELATTATIGQEFELVVLNDLEFQLTLQMKLDPPKPAPPIERPISPARTFVRPKTSTFSRVFGSPKKRRELELRAQQEMEQQAERERQRQRALAVQAIDPWEIVRPLVAKDGSFGRAYIALSEHEKAAYGRPYSTHVACFNEWATEPTAAGTAFSRYGKKVNSATSPMAPTPPPQGRPPYRIGTIELQLLYVPKPKGAEDKDMPKSMNAAIKEMAEAENTATKSWKGFLSQQGGDCPYWRRRFFKLQGSKLTAYHESTLQPRATINLAKAAKLVDDRSILTQKDTSTKGGGRRRSAFAEDEEGYMFVEEGFRIRFGNGEVIDFYADSAAEKENWMEMLSQVVGKSSIGSGPAKAWTEIVLKRERATGFKAGNLPIIQPANNNNNNKNTATPAAAQKQQQQKGPPGASISRPSAPGPGDRPRSRHGPVPSPLGMKQPMSPTGNARNSRQPYPISQANLPSPMATSATPHIPPSAMARPSMTPGVRHSQNMSQSHVDSHVRAMQARHQKTKSMMF